MAELQARMLRRVAGLVEPGGRLLYAVCSVLREEGEAVVDRTVAQGEFEPAPIEGPLGAIAASANSLRRGDL